MLAQESPGDTFGKPKLLLSPLREAVPHSIRAVQPCEVAQRRDEAVHLPTLQQAVPSGRSPRAAPAYPHRYVKLLHTKRIWTFFGSSTKYLAWFYFLFFASTVEF